MKQFNEIFSKSNDWQSFSFQLETLGAKEKGDIFEHLVKEYLTNDPVYKTKLKKVWLLKDVPLKVREYLGLPSTDQGIDLIAETNEGEYWAVQCKYHSNATHNVTWREISTFTGLAFGICKNISFGLLCTTGDRYTQLLSGQEKIGICAYDTWSNLTDDFFSLITNKTNANPVKPYSPRSHQIRAINRAKTHYSYELNKRGKLIMPCGTGKSLTAYWINEALKSSTTLIAVPSISLLRQTLFVWTREFNANGITDIDWICVCSDETVSDNSNDELESLPQDLGVPCTTDSQAIANWLNLTKNSKRRIIFTTYQSSKKIIEASINAGVTYDLGIFDEAHKTVGKHDSLFSLFLFEQNIHITKRLFMTATERRYLGKSSQVASMEDVDIYGETIDLLTFKEALSLKPKIVCDYKILTLFITKSEVADLVLRNKFVKPDNGKWDAEIEAEMLAALVAIKKAMQDFPIRHIVSFHSSISRAKAFKQNADIFTQSLPQYGDLETYHITGNYPASQRQHILTAFSKSDHSLVTNARCLTEGIDLPGIDCVVFADPKKSKVDIVQALGRALRPAENKTYGYIVVPVLMEDTSDIENFAESNAFADLIVTLRALASNDERVIDVFRDKANGKARGNNRLVSDLFAGSMFAQNINIEEFSESVSLYCWDNLVKLAYKPFKTAKRQVRSLGLRSELEWKLYCENQLHGMSPKNQEIPEAPEKVYKEEWNGWKDWLGEGIRGSKYLRFDLAKQLARRQLLSTKEEWHTLDSDKGLPPMVPANPEKIYFREWISWDDWLFGKQKNVNLNFKDAREKARGYKLKSKVDWANRAILDDFNDLPYRPDIHFRNEWISWDDWLGVVENIAVEPVKNESDKTKSRLAFDEARDFARSLGLKSKQEWKLYSLNILPGHKSRPSHIPMHPETRWSKYWISWRDWLGAKAASGAKVENDIYMGFQGARHFARSLGLKSRGEWELYARNRIKTANPIPSRMPINPKSAYSKYWVSWDDWLGNSRNKIKNDNSVEKNEDPYVPFNLARIYVHKLKLSGRVEWIGYTNSEKIPEYIPKRPDIYYVEWTNWDDWLGLSGD